MKLNWRSNLHIIWVIIGRLEKICLEIMNKILSELMKDISGGKSSWEKENQCDSTPRHMVEKL